MRRLLFCGPVLELLPELSQLLFDFSQGIRFNLGLRLLRNASHHFDFWPLPQAAQSRGRQLFHTQYNRIGTELALDLSNSVGGRFSNERLRLHGD